MKRFAFAAVVVIYAAAVFGLQAVLPPEAVISNMTQRVLSEAGKPGAAAGAANRHAGHEAAESSKKTSAS